MSAFDPTDVLEQWIRGQPGGYLHTEVHISNSGETGVHWQASKDVDAGTRYGHMTSVSSEEATVTIMALFVREGCCIAPEHADSAAGSSQCHTQSLCHT